MARLFGTKAGSVERPAGVERRMFALARCFGTTTRGRDDAALPAASRPGRGPTPAEQVPVPFTVVRTKAGWLVENIDILITAGA